MDRKQALQALRELKSGVAQEDQRVPLRKALIASAGSIAKELIVELQQGADLSFRRELLNVIGATRLEMFFLPLSELLEREPGDELAQIAAINIGKLTAPQSYDALVRLLQHDNPQVRFGAIGGLTALRD